MNITSSKKPVKSDIIRTKIAASPRTNNKNNGLKNFTWTMDGWVNSEAELDAIEALVGTAGLTYIDKFGNSFTVSINVWDPNIENHEHYNYTLSLEEDS